MKIYCITDNTELEVGLKLAGCDGITLKEESKIEQKIDEIAGNSEIGILVVSQKIYEQAKDKIDSIRFYKKFPLVTIL